MKIFHMIQKKAYSQKNGLFVFRCSLRYSIDQRLSQFVISYSAIRFPHLEGAVLSALLRIANHGHGHVFNENGLKGEGG